jgi:hypothetical protein
MSYSAVECEDDVTHFRDLLHTISLQNGRVISVLWQPNRTIGDAPDTYSCQSGYLVVYETR